MDRNVIEFISKLRTAGLKVSTSETLDCLSALKYIDTPNARKNVMAATLVKRAADQPVFDKVYNMYFSEHHEDYTSDIENKNFSNHINTGDALEQASQVRKKTGYKELLQNITDNNQTALDEIVNTAVDSLGELKQQGTYKFNDLVRRTQISMEWFMAENQHQRSYWDLPYEEWLEAKERFEHLKQQIEEALRKKIEKDLGAKGQEELLRQMNWKNKNFAELQVEEILEIEKRVQLLGKRLAARLSRRLKRSKTGIIDARRLIRKAAASPDFVPNEFYFLDKKPAKPKLSVICDISGSVARYSRFMLQIIYFLTKRFKDVKAYVFVDGIVEVSEILRTNTWENAFDKIFREAKCSITGYSDYGKVFERFNQKYLIDIDKKTSIILLGDARSNWYPSGVEEFSRMTEKAKRVLWLNPQSKEIWDKEDSIISIYAPYTETVQECSNLGHLERVINKILAW